MGSIDFSMVHSCQVLRDTGTTQNAAGSPIPNLFHTPYKCLFSNISTAGNFISIAEAGKLITSTFLVFLPAEAVVEEGDLVSTEEPNWKGTYEVQKVDAPEIPFSGIVDHKEAFLKAVEKRG
jgi:hypothetical protein